MKINLWIIGFLMTFSCTSSIIKPYQVNISFDSLFPMTWYQKGLESSVYVWQTLANVFDTGSDSTLLSCEVLLGRLTFAQFCINRMYQEGIPCIADDSTYFVAVLKKIQQLLALVIVTPKTHDFIVCANDMITSMQEKLNATE